MLIEENNFRESEHIGEEMLSQADLAMDSKCRSVERTTGDGIFTLEKALKLYKVPKETYFAYIAKKHADDASRKNSDFKEPKIVKSKNGDWYVSYFFKDPDNATKFKEFKERCGLNYIKDIEQKEKEFEILRMDVLNWLTAGNSPFDEQVEIERIVNEVENEIHFNIKSKSA